MIEVQKIDGRTIVMTGSRIDTVKANEFEQDIQPILAEKGVNLEIDCSRLTFMASSGLRIVQNAMRTVMMNKGQFKMTNVRPEVYKVLAMTGFTKFIKVEKLA